MSVEIVEHYPSLREIKFILSMNYEQFRPYSLRWNNEQDRKELYTRIRKMCEEIVRAKGTITRVYNHSLSTPAGLGGRLFGPSSIQIVPREIRGLIMKHTTDIDMKNAHPTILRYLCRKHNIKHSELDYFINHREQIIGTGENREEMKNLYLKALNKDKIVPEIKDFSKEIIKIQTQLMTVQEFSGIADTLEGKKWNKSGSYLNKCLCIYENLILQKVRTFLNENNYTVRCLAFDGIMIDGSHYQNQELLRTIESVVNSSFPGLDAAFSYKPHDNSIIIPDNFDENEKNENNDGYLNWKKEFELTHAKIMGRSFFVRTVKDQKGFITEIRPMTKKDIVVSYEHMTYDEPKETKSGSVMVKKSCIQRWLTDETMLCYDEMGCYPPPLSCPDNHLNIWTPFYVEQLLPSSEMLTDENKEDYIQKTELIVEHINVLCNRDPADFLFMQKWLGQMLKYPALKTVAPTLISNEGAGKGTLTYFIQRLIGRSKFLETTDPAKYVWGQFNELMVDKYIVNCDEMDYKAQQECDGKIKGLITNNNLTINPKGVKSFTIQSYHRFLFTTNNEVPLKTHKSDRRNKIIRSSDEKIGDSQYFIDLRNAIDDDIVLRMMYECLTSIEGLETFHTERIEQNEYQQTLAECAVPIPEQFLRYLTENHGEDDENTFTATELLDQFASWRDCNSFKYECDSAKLLRNLKLLKIPGWCSTVKTKKCNKTQIYFSVLRQHFNIGLDSSLEGLTDDEN